MQTIRQSSANCWNLDCEFQEYYFNFILLNCSICCRLMAKLNHLDQAVIKIFREACWLAASLVINWKHLRAPARNLQLMDMELVLMYLCICWPVKTTAHAPQKRIRSELPGGFSSAFPHTWQLFWGFTYIYIYMPPPLLEFPLNSIVLINRRRHAKMARLVL